MKRDVFHQLYFHVVWSTAGRVAALEGRRDGARECITAVARKFGAHVLACNTMPDHVHLLVSLPPTDIAQFIGRVKGGSSFALNRESEIHPVFRWQDGYGVVSLRKSDVPTVVRYIANQEQIHAERITNRDFEQTDIQAASAVLPVQEAD